MLQHHLLHVFQTYWTSLFPHISEVLCFCKLFKEDFVTFCLRSRPIYPIVVCQSVSQYTSAKSKQALRTRSCVLRIFSYSQVAARKPLGSCQVAVRQLLASCYLAVRQLLFSCLVAVWQLLGSCWVAVGSCWVAVGQLLVS